MCLFTYTYVIRILSIVFEVFVAVCIIGVLFAEVEGICLKRRVSRVCVGVIFFYFLSSYWYRGFLFRKGGIRFKLSGLLKLLIFFV